MPVGLSIGRVLEDLVSLKLCESGIALHRIVLYASTVVYLVQYEISIVIQCSLSIKPQHTSSYLMNLTPAARRERKIAT